MKTPAKNVNKKFFYMVAATIVFSVKGEDGAKSMTQLVPINCMVVNEKDQFGAEQLAKAQTGAQMAFFKKLGDEASNVEVVDVVINTINNLGYMTDEEFHHRPEVKKPDLSVVGKALAESGVSVVQ